MTSDLHWTVYVTAIGTPIVAVIAAAIAGLFAYRNWRTAQNKLKLDLFDRRLEVYEQLNKIRDTVAHAPFSDDPEIHIKFMELRPKFRWMFDDKVNNYVDLFAFKVRAYALLNEGTADDLVIPKDASIEDQEKMIREVKKWMHKQQLSIQDVFHHSLKLEQ